MIGVASAAQLHDTGVVDVDTAHLPVNDVPATRSGHWRMLDAEQNRELTRYVWTLDENPRFVRVMVCKRIFAHEGATDPNSI